MSNKLSTSQTIDTVLRDATRNPYDSASLPRLVVVAARGQEIVYSGAAGYAQLPSESNSGSKGLLEKATRVTETDVFELYSCTKLLAAIAALQLVEKGVIALDDDAAKWIPELDDVKIFQGFDNDGKAILEEKQTPITIDMLLTHTSGSAYPGDIPDLAKYVAQLDQPGMYRRGFTKKHLAAIPLGYAPGSHFAYGPSLDWLSWVVEAASGLSLEAYFQENIFRPLGISDTSFLNNPDQISMATCQGPGTSYTFSNERDINQEQYYGGAGLAGSPMSYLKIVQSLLPKATRRILSQDSVNLMCRPHLANEQQRIDLQTMSKNGNDPFTRKLEGTVNPEADYGYGGLLSGRDFESGRRKGSLTWSGMASTFWVLDSQSDLAFIVFTNVLPYGQDAIFDAWREVETQIYKGL